MKSGLLLAVGLASLGARQVPTQVPPPQTGTAATPAATPLQSFGLKYQPKEGDTSKFKYDGVMELVGGQAFISGVVTQKVLKVDPDGTYTIQSSPGEGSLKFSGQTLPIPKYTSVTLYKSDGEIVNVSGEKTDATSIRYANLTMLRRPDKDQKIGDSWTMDLKSDTQNGSVPVHGLFRLESAEKIGKYDTLKISADIRETAGLDAGSSASTFWIDQNNGSIVKYQSKYTNVAFPGNPRPLSGTYNEARVDG